MKIDINITIKKTALIIPQQELLLSPKKKI